MSERLLYDMYRRSAVERVRGVGMARQWGEKLFSMPAPSAARRTMLYYLLTAQRPVLAALNASVLFSIRPSKRLEPLPQAHRAARPGRVSGVYCRSGALSRIRPQPRRF